MLKLRLLTALILIPLVILGIFYLPRPLFIWITIIIFSMAAWEWARLSGWSKLWLKLFYILLIILAMMLTSRLPQGGVLAIAIGALWWSLIVAWLLKIRKADKLIALPQWALLLSGFLVLIPCWQAILWLSQDPALLFYMLLMIWVCDSAAYFGGRAWGKRKLAVTISPNKTHEGLFAGIIVTVLFSIVAAWFLSDPHQLKLSWILPVLPLIVAAVAGDLFESALKRMQDLKDSGGLLPGHGGVLDRLDSLTAAAPVFACTVIFLQQAGL
jgi:phosphatidate cytidylyltransferase